MSWAKFDDRYHDNPKINAAWNLDRSSVGLHAMSITFCSMHETDGLVPPTWLQQKIPNAKQRNRAVDALIAAGLYEAVGDGRFIVHDYLDFNPSSAQLQERRRKDSERKRKPRDAEFRPESNGTPSGFREESE